MLNLCHSLLTSFLQSRVRDQTLRACLKKTVRHNPAKMDNSQDSAPDSPFPHNLKCCGVLCGGLAGMFQSRTLQGLILYGSVKPVWPSGPANGCSALGRPSASHLMCYGHLWFKWLKVGSLPLICRFDHGTHLTDESERTLDLPTRQSRQDTSPWLSTE